uniref:Suppressor of cytokine signaling 2 n=1 Tax=Leptobrachium leishanense TaxID=445787 RepID=A0A8C5PQ68_9ANUR
MCCCPAPVFKARSGFIGQIVLAEQRSPPRSPMTLRSPETSDDAGVIQNGSGQRGSANVVTEVEPDKEDPIAVSMGELRRSGWYWGNMSVGEAKERLQDSPEGTFLVRDSSHTDYLLTISVKTSAGPTNLRIEYREGKFRLDSVVCVRSRLKQFDSVGHLIQYYVLLSKNKKLESETLPTRTVHLWLVKPLYTSTPSLQHLCRLTINRCTSQINDLPLPTRLKDYLTEYNYQNPIHSCST